MHRKAILAAVFIFLAIDAQAYRCPRDGVVYLQEKPCPSPVKQEKIKPAEPEREMTAKEIQEDFEREMAEKRRQEAVKEEERKKQAAEKERQERMNEERSQRPRETQKQDTSNDSFWMVRNKELMRQRLKDPYSAEFRNVFVSRSSGSPVVCGQVNAKNSFGGYAGYKRFISAGSVMQVMESDMAPGEMDQLWNQACR